MHNMLFANTYIYKHAHSCAHTHTHTQCIHTHAHTCSHTHTHMLTHVTHKYAHMHTHTHTHTHTHKGYVHTHTHTHILTHTQVHANTQNWARLKSPWGVNAWPHIPSSVWSWQQSPLCHHTHHSAQGGSPHTWAASEQNEIHSLRINSMNICSKQEMKIPYPLRFKIPLSDPFCTVMN